MVHSNIAILQPLIEEKRDALQNYQRNLSPRYLEALRQARGRAVEECENCANNYWMSLCTEIQSAAFAGNIRGLLFEGIKKVIGPTQSKCASLKTSTGQTITDKSKLMLCWAEHYRESSMLVRTLSHPLPSTKLRAYPRCLR